MAQNKMKGQAFDEGDIENLMEDFKFEIANHSAIIQDLCRKTRCLMQEKKNVTKLEGSRTPSLTILL